MNYNPNIHKRRSVRLKGYDYSQAGLYFITICCNTVGVRMNNSTGKIRGDDMRGYDGRNEPVGAYGIRPNNSENLEDEKKRKTQKCRAYGVCPYAHIIKCR